MMEARSHRPILHVLPILFLLIASGGWVSPANAEEAAAAGPDVTVFDLYGANHYGNVGSLHAYAVGTVSCNQGTEPLNWCDENNNGCAPGAEVTDHPVIAQNLYRLKEGRFEQLGMSWLKHGFLSVNGSGAGCGDGSCEQPPEGGDQLGVGCTDPYGWSLNGSRPLGRRSTTNASTGEHPTRPNNGGSGNIAERLQVEQADIDPDLNPGAVYWVEGHYVAPDDAIEGNGLNNASHRLVAFSDTFEMSYPAGSATVREKAAVYAWQQQDPAVELRSADIPSSRPTQRFHAARKVYVDGGVWHYEYVIHNLNSDRGGRLFKIDLGPGAMIFNTGFRDVDHHSGEPYEVTDWSVVVDQPAGSVTWSTDSFDIDEDANALRWGSMFSFWFDSDTAPTNAVHTLEFFKPGDPSSVIIPFVDNTLVFQDGFESSDTSGWTSTVIE